MSDTEILDPKHNDPYVQLTSHGLHLLHSALQTANLGATAKIVEDIKREHNIDLADDSQLAILNETQYNKLRKYEKTNTDFLVAIVINEYPGAAKYLSRIFKQDTMIDPLGTFQKWFGAFVFGVGILYLFAVTFFPINEANKEFASIITGVIIGQILAIPMGYIFRNRQESNFQPLAGSDNSKAQIGKTISKKK